MPDFAGILAYYRAIMVGASHGALAGEARSFARCEYERVASNFLSPVERVMLGILPGRERQGRLRKGEMRFRRWEAANPDVVALLMRKAERQALGAG